MKNIKPGMCFYQKQGSGNTGYKFHVVCILDEPEPQVVFKFFGKNKKRWFYEIDSLYGFNSALETGLYYTKN